MPRPSLTEEQRREIRRSIRAAASKLHDENGMRDISVRAIAETAGVSVGTIYSHFGNLTELMQSLWKQPARHMIQELLKVADEQVEPVVRLQQLFATYIQFAHDNWSVYKGAFMFVRPEGHEPPPQIDLTEDRMFSLIRDSVLEGQQSGVIRAGNPDEITQTLWSGIHGALALPINFHRLALNGTNQRVDQMSDLLFDWLTDVEPQT